MREHGKLYTCDRCKMQGFFAHEPESWGYDFGIGDLCPRCNGQLEKIKEKFKKSAWTL